MRTRSIQDMQATKLPKLDVSTLQGQNGKRLKKSPMSRQPAFKGNIATSGEYSLLPINYKPKIDKTRVNLKQTNEMYFEDNGNQNDWDKSMKAVDEEEIVPSIVKMTKKQRRKYKHFRAGSGVDPSFQESFERSFEKFRDVFAPPHQSALDQAHREVRMLNKVNKTIEDSQKTFIRKTKRMDENTLDTNDYNTYVRGQSQLVGVPKQRVDKLLRNVWAKTCEEEKRNELDKAIKLGH